MNQTKLGLIGATLLLAGAGFFTWQSLEHPQKNEEIQISRTHVIKPEIKLNPPKTETQTLLINDPFKRAAELQEKQPVVTTNTTSAKTTTLTTATSTRKEPTKPRVVPATKTVTIPKEASTKTTREAKTRTQAGKETVPSPKKNTNKTQAEKTSQEEEKAKQAPLKLPTKEINVPQIKEAKKEAANVRLSVKLPQTRKNSRAISSQRKEEISVNLSTTRKTVEVEAEEALNESKAEKRERPAELSSYQLRLTAYVPERPSQSSAVIWDGKRERILQIGQQLDTFIIKDINEKSIEVEKQGESHRLEMVSLGGKQ